MTENEKKALQEQFKSVFHNDYPGYNEFAQKVIIPIFGNDYSALPYPEDLLANASLKEDVTRANIIKFERIGEIDSLDSDPIRVFDVTLNNSCQIARSRVGIQRIVRRQTIFEHSFILFHYEDPKDKDWRFSYVYKGGTQKETTDAKRFTYVFGKDYMCNTAKARFVGLADSAKTDKDLTDAFSVEALSDEFFDKYREIYADFVQYITGKRYVHEGGKWVEKSFPGEPQNTEFYAALNNDDKRVRDFVKKMMGRITFLYFLQQKGWMCGDKNYMLSLYSKSTDKDQYLKNVLCPLFFGVLNTKPEDRAQLFKDNGWNDTLRKEWKDVPYLNGGLFDMDSEDKAISACKTHIFREEDFTKLFNFFSEYNFTIDENDPKDAEVGVDPEMLGKIFESLLEDNKEKGAFYTPKEIVQYMCKESLTTYLCSKTGYDRERIHAFVQEPDENVSTFNTDEQVELLGAILDVKICDPAIGSGAFPMGLLNELVHCKEAIYGDDKGRAEIKKEIIQNNIYGVDIEKGAVDIARLRFWLALVVDEDKPLPLPNLDYKIMQGNSLLEEFNGVDLSKLTDKKENAGLFDEQENDIKSELDQLLNKYYRCSDHKKKASLKADISELIRNQLIQFERRGTFGENVVDMRSVDISANTDFFLWHTWFGKEFKKGGFDIIIGNPPYIEAKKLKYIASKLKKHYQIYSGTADLSIYFAELGLNLLKANGVLSFITTNKFFYTGYGKNLRQLFINNQINRLINFEQVEVFKDVLVSSVIIEVQKSPCSSAVFEYERFEKLGHKEFKIIFNNKIGHFGNYHQSSLNENEWSFADATSLILKQKIESGSSLIGDVPGVHVYRGVTTGYNPAFIISSERKAELINQHHSSSTVIKNMLQGRNVRKWFYNKSDEKLIFTRKGIDIDSYPAIKEHLHQFFDDLKPKKTSDEEHGRKPGTYKWYEILDNTAYYPHFEKEEKIIWGLTADKWAFTLDTEKHYLPSNGYILTSETIPCKYILGVLNSKLLHHYFKYIGVMTAGGAYTLKAATIEALPFKTDGPQNEIIQLVDSILSVKSSDHEADVSDQENKIDILVYKMYGLSYSEVLMVDPAFELTEDEYYAS